jgi:hypothetical protein
MIGDCSRSVVGGLPSTTHSIRISDAPFFAVVDQLNDPRHSRVFECHSAPHVAFGPVSTRRKHVSSPAAQWEMIEFDGSRRSYTFALKN